MYTREVKSEADEIVKIVMSFLNQLQHYDQDQLNNFQISLQQKKGNLKKLAYSALWILDLQVDDVIDVFEKVKNNFPDWEKHYARAKEQVKLLKQDYYQLGLEEKVYQQAEEIEELEEKVGKQQEQIDKLTELLQSMHEQIIDLETANEPKSSGCRPRGLFNRK